MPKKSKPEAKCAVSSCQHSARTRGWCHMHYYRWWKTGTTSAGLKVKHLRKKCSIDRCRRPAAARGWCDAHYQRWNGGYKLPMSVPIKRIDRKVRKNPEGLVCKSPVCERKAISLGMCMGHYKRYHRTGEARLWDPIG